MRINLGVAPVKGLLIWSEFQKDVDISNSWNLNTKYVMEFNNSALNIQGGFGKNTVSVLSAASIYPASMKLSFNGVDDNITSVYLLSDYYFNDTLSLGIGVSHADYDKYDLDDSYMIRGKKFFTKNFSIQAQYMQNDYRDNYNIGASMRF